MSPESLQKEFNITAKTEERKKKIKKQKNSKKLMKEGDERKAREKSQLSGEAVIRKIY